MPFPKIKQVCAFVVRDGGADYHDQGTLVVEIEAENGVTGFAVPTGGEPACIQGMFGPR